MARGRHQFVDIEKNCLICGERFRITDGRAKNKKCCSRICKQKYDFLKSGRSKSFSLPTGTIGTIAEVTVMVDLLKKGYEVYRPVTPNCSGDLLIEKDDIFLKIEVRTGYRHKITKNILINKKNVRSKILAGVFFDTNEIIYFSFPSLDEYKM